LGLRYLPQLGAILLVAITGKFVGATIAARAQGVPTQQASVIGVLMNTRGLTELVILNVGASIGVLDPQLFTMMVIMAILTTVMTEPLLRLVYPDRQLERDIAEAERTTRGIVDAYRVLVAVDNPMQAKRLGDAALAAVGDERPAEIVLAHFIPHAGGQEITAGVAAELATMARSNIALSALVAQAQAQGAQCTLLSRLSDDVVSDLLSAARTLKADVLLVDGEQGRGAFLQRLLRQAACDVVIMVDPQGQGVRSGVDRPIVLVAGDRLHDAAACEFGIRLARGLGIGAIVVDDAAGGRRPHRRTAALLDGARPLGVPLTATVAESGLEAEVARLSADAAALAVGIDEDGLEDGRLGLRSDRLLRVAHIPAFVVSSPANAARKGLRSLQRQRDWQ
jgi:hypothetical protein